MVDEEGPWIYKTLQSATAFDRRDKLIPYEVWKRNAMGHALECSMESLRKSSLLSVSEEHGPKELLSTQSLIKPLLWPASSKTWWLNLLYPVVVSWTVRSWWATEKPHKVPLMLRKMAKMPFLSKMSDGLQSLHAVGCYCCASMSPHRSPIFTVFTDFKMSV